MIRVNRLRIDGIRNLVDIDFRPGSGLNVFVGDNGAGKTSLLESLHCLSRGRSFLGSGRHEYLNRERRKAVIVAHLENDAHEIRVLGLERETSQWTAKAAGVELGSLAALAEQFPFCVFHPGLHRLVEGNPEERRRFLDFGVFHVEHSFLHHWRRYRSTLKQRNAAIRRGSGVEEIVAWNPALIEHGEAIAQFRQQHLEQLRTSTQYCLAEFAPTLKDVALTLARGWGDDQSLREAIDDGLSQDREQGFTTRGPHRADLRMVLQGQRVAGRLSRGQQKMLALALLLGQVYALAEAGQAPVMGFDDLPSELDEDHQLRVLELVRRVGGQVWVTGNVCPAGISPGGIDKVFHVEQGRLTELVQ